MEIIATDDQRFMDQVMTPTLTVKLSSIRDERVYDINVEQPGYKAGWFPNTTISMSQDSYSVQPGGGVSDPSLALQAIYIADPDRWTDSPTKMKVGEMRKVTTKPMYMLGLEIVSK